jgi:hypothetical protein
MELVYPMDIGLLNEKPLHAALKDWYAQPGDRFEVKVDGYFIDIIHDDMLIEIQTGNFSAIKRKVNDLLQRHSLRLVYPIAKEKWIIKPSGIGGPSIRRKSPKRGQLIEVFKELVSFPASLNCENFSLEVLLIQEEEVRKSETGRGWRRRGWVTQERRLLEVVGRHLFQIPADFWKIIPDGLPEHFTTTDLARNLKISRRLSQQVAYCLRKMGIIQKTGMRNRSNEYVKI